MEFKTKEEESGEEDGCVGVGVLRSVQIPSRRGRRFDMGVRDRGAAGIKGVG